MEKTIADRSIHIGMALVPSGEGVAEWIYTLNEKLPDFGIPVKSNSVVHCDDFSFSGRPKGPAPMPERAVKPNSFSLARQRRRNRLSDRRSLPWLAAPRQITTVDLPSDRE